MLFNMDTQVIWTNFHRELKGFIIKTIKNTHDADDVLQDVFLKILKHQDKIAQADNLRHYIYGMVRNTIHDYFRKKQPFAELPTDESMAHYDLDEQQLNEAIAVCCVQPFIQQLPEKYSTALRMAELEQIPQTEIAERLHISYSGAKSRVQRGKAQLKALIMDCCVQSSDRYGNVVAKDIAKCGCAYTERG